MSFQIYSPAWRPGEEFPRKHTCDGANLSPPLRWSDPLHGTRSFARVADDPDAPAGRAHRAASRTATASSSFAWMPSSGWSRG